MIYPDRLLEICEDAFLKCSAEQQFEFLAKFTVPLDMNGRVRRRDAAIIELSKLMPDLPTRPKAEKLARELQLYQNGQYRFDKQFAALGDQVSVKRRLQFAALKNNHDQALRYRAIFDIIR